MGDTRDDEPGERGGDGETDGAGERGRGIAREVEKRSGRTADDGEWDILCRLQDPVAAGALVSLLDAEKIPSATPGLAHRGMLGFLGAYVEIVVSVPRRDVARARELLAALEATPDGAPDAGEVPPASGARDATEAPDRRERRPIDESRPKQKKNKRSDGAASSVAASTKAGAPAAAAAQGTDSDAGPSSESPRQRRVAAFVALTLTFGTGHFYVRDIFGGALLFGAELVALGCAFFGAPLVALSLPVIVACDFIGAQLILTRLRAGQPASALGRLLPVLALLAVALAPVVRATSPETLAAPAGVLACEVISQCGGPARMICIEELADRRMAGALSSTALEACALCLEPTHTCAGVEACAAACAQAVEIPVRALPAGVRTDDDDFVRMLGGLPGVDEDLLERLRDGPAPPGDE